MIQIEYCKALEKLYLLVQHIHSNNNVLSLAQDNRKIITTLYVTKDLPKYSEIFLSQGTD